MILKARRVQGLATSLSTNTTKDLVKLKGPGVFVSMYVTKQGGSNDITQVALYLDGQNVVANTYIGAANIGLGKRNNSGITHSAGIVDMISVQFNEPLNYAKELRVEITTGSDSGVLQIVAEVVVGSGAIYPNS
jgi:hypothetical protein